jgi:uncharacterized protein (DUF433 family)
VNEFDSYVSVDGNGVRRVAGTRISLDSVVIGFQQGQSAEEIQRNFPELRLEQVYGAITHYLSHRDDVDVYLRQQREAWNISRVENERTPNAAIERLRTMRADVAGKAR